MTASSNITIDDSDIAWESDVQHKFKNMDIDNWESKQWLDVTNRKYSFTLKKIFRAFHCLDEDSRSTKFPQTLWKDRPRPTARHLLHQDPKQLQCELFQWAQILRHFNNEHPWWTKLFPCDLLYHCRLSLHHVRYNLLHCIHEQKESTDTRYRH